MFTRRFAFVASAVVLVALLSVGSTQAASSFSRINHLTFSGPVSLPGVTLAAGTYTFEAGPRDTDPHLVRVTTRDGQRILYQGLTTPVSRPSGRNVAPVMLGEAPAGQPAPIRVWYPMRSTIGHQFRY
jgi:hypothetical protein